MMIATSQTSIREPEERAEGRLVVELDPCFSLDKSTSGSWEGQVPLQRQVSAYLRYLMQAYFREAAPRSDTESLLETLQAAPKVDAYFLCDRVSPFTFERLERGTELPSEYLVRAILMHLKHTAREMPKFQADLTDRAREELAQSENTPWAVDDAIFALRRQLRERGLEGHIMVDAIQDPESPPPPVIAITVSVQELTSQRWFELWDALAKEVELAIGPWKPDHRVVIVVRRSQGGEWSQGNSTSSR